MNHFNPVAFVTLLVFFFHAIHPATAEWPNERGQERRTRVSSSSLALERSTSGIRKRLLRVVREQPQGTESTATVHRRRTLQKTRPDQERVMERILQDMEEVLDETPDYALWMLSLSMSQSTSTTSPTIMNATMAPSASPSTNSTDTVTLVPTIILDDDNATDTTGTVSHPQLPLFVCNAAATLSLEPAMDGEIATEFFLTVGYTAESTSMDTGDFVKELQRQLLETAVAAALNCNGSDSGGAGRALRVRDQGHRQVLEMDAVGRMDRRLYERQFAVMSDSTIVGLCDVTLEGAESCFTIETSMLFYLRNSVNADIATYLAYKAIEEDMVQDKYIGIVPTILMLKYLSPLPLVIPPEWNGTDSKSNGGVGNTIGVNQENAAIVQSTMATTNGPSQVSSWTIGACVATLMGAIISLFVYKRKPARHQAREDIPVTPKLSRARTPVTI